MSKLNEWTNKIICGDCLELMKRLPDGCVDLVVTDPPFTFGLGSSISNTKIGNWYDLLNGSHFFSAVFEECRRVSRLNSAFWIFNSWRSSPCFMKGLLDIGLFINSMLIWDKDWIAAGGSKGLRPSYEQVAFVPIGDFSIPDRGIRDIQKFPWSAYKPHHPAEKPLELISWLIKISGDVQTILDPFMGSGTTAVACKQLNRQFIGFEINQKYVDIANERLKQEVFAL